MTKVIMAEIHIPDDCDPSFPDECAPTIYMKGAEETKSIYRGKWRSV